MKNNPLIEFISNEQYDKLSKEGLLNENGVRNYQMRKRYQQLRKAGYIQENAINELRKEYPYLSYDRLRIIAGRKPQ